MRQKLFRVGMAWCLLITLVSALYLVPIGSSPVAAQSVEDLFNITYETSLSKTEVSGSEVFSATIQGEARCEEDLEFPYNLVSEARVTGRVVATHQASGAKVTLNSSYTVTIDPFPTKKGETTQSSVDVSLQFPGGSQSGTYNVVGELIEAEVYVLGIAISATEYLPSSQIIGSVTYVALDGGGGGGGGWGDESTAGTVSISDIIDWQGIITQSVEALSVDGKCTLAISEGTKALTKYAQPLRRISIFEEVNPPASPADTEVIGLTYDLSPDGATFDPPVDLTFVYSRNSIPEGVAEKDLVIAMWDINAGKWVVLDDCTVSTSTHTITAKVAHFTYFTVLAHTKPAAFTVSALSITPQEVSIGEEVTISVSVANTGNLSGSYEVTLKIDNKVIETQEVTLAGGAGDTVTFKIAEEAANTYSVNLNGLSGSFVVKPAATPGLEPEQTPAPTSEPTSEPTPESTPELIPAPIPTPTSPPAEPIDWLVLSGVIAGVVAVGLLIFFLTRRRSY